LSETGKFIKSNKEEKKKTKEIHPLTHIKKSKSKQKLVLKLLLILTLINISLAIYFLYPKNDKSLNTMHINHEPVKQETESQKSKNKQKKNVELAKLVEKKLSYPKYDLSFSLEDLKLLKIDVDIPEMNPQKTLLLKKQPEVEKNFNYYYTMAKELESKYDKVSALYYYRKAYKLNPDPDILYKIAYLNYKLRAYLGAIKYTKKLIKENPKYIDGYLLLSNIYLKLRKTKDAKLTLEEAYYKFPENMKLVNSLAYIYEKTGNPYAALELYEALSEKGNLEATIKAAKLYEKLGEKDKALEYYRKALSVDKGKYKTWLKDKIKKLSS